MYWLNQNHSSEEAQSHCVVQDANRKQLATLRNKNVALNMDAQINTVADFSDNYEAVTRQGYTRSRGAAAHRAEPLSRKVLAPVHKVSESGALMLENHRMRVELEASRHRSCATEGGGPNAASAHVFDLGVPLSALNRMTPTSGFVSTNTSSGRSENYSFFIISIYIDRIKVFRNYLV